MPFSEPVIPIGVPNGSDSGASPEPSLAFLGSHLPIYCKTVKLPTYVVGTDVPKAIPIANAAGTSARIRIEAAGGAVAGAVIARYWLDGKWPTQTTGIAMYDKELIEITGVQTARFVSADALQHILQIQIFQ